MADQDRYEAGGDRYQVADGAAWEGEQHHEGEYPGGQSGRVKGSIVGGGGHAGSVANKMTPEEPRALIAEARKALAGEESKKDSGGINATEEALANALLAVTDALEAALTVQDGDVSERLKLTCRVCRSGCGVLGRRPCCPVPML